MAKQIFAHIFDHLDSISFIVPLSLVNCGYFEYKNFSGKFCGAEILIVEARDSNKSIYFKQT